LRIKVSLAARADWWVTAAFSAPASARDAQLGIDTDTVELDMGGAGGARRLRIALGGAPAKELQGSDARPARWAAFDMQHGLPRLGASQSEHWTPQQLSLERLRGFSVKKGCYPGQEIVARTHFLGKAKRGLALLEGAAPIAAGAEVHGDGAPLGTVVCSSLLDDRWLGMAVLPLDRKVAALSIAGEPVMERPLLDGLAR
jgi:folate-binding protein YgfZ